MLESTQAAYTATVSNIAAKIQRTQSILNAGAGEVVTGVTAYNQAVRESVKKMVQNGITGFVDHGGHRWSPEAYAAMDIRTTMNNVARAATWERNEGYGNDLYQVSWHNGARPLCYPWQGKVISRSDMVREVEDLDGNTVHVYAQSETSYGEAAGLFGVNCGHYAMVFIPGISTLYDVPQNEEENAKDYEESQQQRALEHKLREEKRDLEVMKAQGASEEEIKAQKERVKKASSDIQTFCDDTGRTRRRDREATPTRATWPKELKEVTRFNGGYIDVNKTPQPKGTVSVAPSIKPPSGKIVASQATQKSENVVKSLTGAKSELVTKDLPRWNIKQVELEKWDKTPTTEDIIAMVGGGDKTRGSCASCSFAYAGNKAGYKIRDFRGGESTAFFATSGHIKEIGKFDGVVSRHISAENDFKAVGELIKEVVDGKEYILATGQHAAIIRKIGSGYEYLELQSTKYNGFHKLNNDMLKARFACKKSHSIAGQKLSLNNVLIDVDSLIKSPDFVEMLKYINTPESEQRKGVGGGVK